MPPLPSSSSWPRTCWAAAWLTPSWVASALTIACLPASVPNTALMTRCAVACDTPVDEAKAAMPAAVLPPACFAAMSPPSSWLTLIPADAASDGSGDGAAGDLLAPGDACGGAGLLALDDACGGGVLLAGEPGPDANAAAGSAIAVAVITPATARRRCSTDMGAPVLGSDTSSPPTRPKIRPPAT